MNAMSSNDPTMPQEFCLDRSNVQPLSHDMDTLQYNQSNMFQVSQDSHAEFVTYIEGKLVTYEEHLEYMMAEKLLIKLGITHKEIKDIICVHGNCYSDAWVNQFQFDSRMG